jgi:hypothetical protein
MAGTKRTGLVLQERDLRLLRELQMMRVLDREQVRVVAGLRSVTRANARLLKLTRIGLLRRVTVGTERGGHKFLYALTPAGARAADVPYSAVPLNTHAIIAGQPFLEHQLRLNALYLRLRYDSPPNTTIQRWRTFQQPIAKNLKLIPDAYFELVTKDGLKAMFVEVDRGTESLRIWRGKVNQYLALAVSGQFPQVFGQQQFRVLVVVPSMRRLQTVSRCIAATTTKIFWLAANDSIDREPWGPIWCRPTDNRPQSLI